MSEGTRIEGSSPKRVAAATFPAGEKKLTENFSTQPTVIDKQLLTDTETIRSERKHEQSQNEVTRSRTAPDEGTKRKSRNAIILMMLIMSVVSDTLKDSANSTKEISKLEKRMWKHHSDGQSANFRQGEKCQTWMMCGKLTKMGCELLASKYQGTVIPMLNVDANKTLSALGTVTGGYADSIFPQEQQRIQIEDAKFQFKVGHSGSDYQNQSQQISSDNQIVDSAHEKGIQLGRLMVQIMTAQSV